MPVPLCGLNGKGDAYANPLSDDDWQRLAKVKDLTPGDDGRTLTMITTWMMKTRLDRDGQGRVSGDTSFTLAWNRRKKVRKAYSWFESGDVRAIKSVSQMARWMFPWLVAVSVRPYGERSDHPHGEKSLTWQTFRGGRTQRNYAATAIKVTPTSGTVAKGNTTLTVSFEPESATDKTFRRFRRSVESHLM
ncbi:hypothetical protein DXX76_028030 [Escherichia coli]|nr:hypothetical protein DXX76_028030 [Escherichia coli]